MLNNETFKTVVASTPLVSIDLVLVCQGQMLLGLRNNEPLKGHWFTPGGRIAKNERWQDALRRIAKAELGLDLAGTDCTLMGICDHFYENSAVGDEVSTHYVNLPHIRFFDEFPVIKPDTQHHELRWHDLNQVASERQYHEYMNLYAKWVLEHLNKQRK